MWRRTISSLALATCNLHLTYLFQERQEITLPIIQSTFISFRFKNLKKKSNYAINCSPYKHHSNKINGFLKNGDYSTISKLKEPNNNPAILQSPQSFNKVVDPFSSSDIVPCILQQQYMIQPKSDSTDSCIRHNISTSESNMESNHNPEVEEKAYDDNEHYESIDIGSPNHYGASIGFGLLK